MPRVVRQEIKKRFSKSSFRLPQTAQTLAQQYNIKPVAWWERWRGRVILLWLLALMFGVTYSGLFKIKNLIIDNVSSPATTARIAAILRQYLSQTKLYVLPQDNLLLFSSPAAAQTLKQELNIRELEFDRQWPNVLRLTIKEDLIVGILKVANTYYTVDKRGVVIQQLADPTTEPALITIVNRGLTEVSLGSQITDSVTAEFIVDLAAEWRERQLSPDIDSVEFTPEDLPTLYLVTTAGWEVIISTRESLTDQLDALRALLSERLRDDQAKLEYVDLRFGSKLFFKFKD